MVFDYEGMRVTTTYGLLVPGAGRQSEACRMTSDNANALPDLQYRYNLITVWREADNTLSIHCGHCLMVVNPSINSGWFCCWWASNMYKQYIQQRGG